MQTQNHCDKNFDKYFKILFNIIIFLNCNCSMIE